MGLEGQKVRCFYLAMTTTLIEIRRAKSSDAMDVAETHDEAWRAAYQGIIPGNELDKLINRRGRMVGLGDPQGQPHHHPPIRGSHRRLRELRAQSCTQPLL
jgi:hypothetical protein